MFTFMLKYFWLIAFIITVINSLIYNFRISSRVPEDEQPAVKEFSRNYMIWLSLPWIVMAIGTIFGNVPTVFHFFIKPGLWNFIFFGSLILMWILAIQFVFSEKGAVFIDKYKDIFFKGMVSVGIIKFSAIAGLIMCIAIMIAINLGVFPIPENIFETWQ